jgi:signal transduction histidine kinase
MSLRTKMMVSIFVFMVLVFGLLTLNLWITAAMRAQTESERNADLVARMVGDLVRAWTSRQLEWNEEAWAELSRKLEHSELIERWVIVARRDGKLEPMISSERNPDAIVQAESSLLGAAFDGMRVTRDGARIYFPLQSPQDERFAARLDVRASAVPGFALADTAKGILTVMALGTALLLLNTYVFTNRLVLRPLGSLVEASNRVAQGDFSKKIPEGENYDEMGRMIVAFNLMIDKIAQYHRSMQNDIEEARGRITETERRLFAAQRLSTTGTLAAGIAHEINNPLGGMINAARSLQEGRLEEAKRAEYLDLIVDGLERVRAIVQKILQFRPRPFEPQPVRLRESVDQAIAFLHHRTRAKEVTIQNDLPADLPAVNGDPLELQQAFLNILMNAVDACVMGEGRVTVAHRLAPDALSVSVTDNGCGMEEGELARCMDPFFTTKDVGEGTGLGLSVAHNIVTNHGGRIDLASQRGRGTTVTVTLPLAKAPLPVPERTPVSH